MPRESGRAPRPEHKRGLIDGLRHRLSRDAKPVKDPGNLRGRRVPGNTSGKERGVVAPIAEAAASTAEAAIYDKQHKLTIEQQEEALALFAKEKGLKASDVTAYEKDAYNFENDPFIDEPTKKMLREIQEEADQFEQQLWAQDKKAAGSFSAVRQARALREREDPPTSLADVKDPMIALRMARERRTFEAKQTELDDTINESQTASEDEEESEGAQAGQVRPRGWVEHAGEAVKRVFGGMQESAAAASEEFAQDDDTIETMVDQIETADAEAPANLSRQTRIERVSDTDTSRVTRVPQESAPAADLTVENDDTTVVEDADDEDSIATDVYRLEDEDSAATGVHRVDAELPPKSRRRLIYERPTDEVLFDPAAFGSEPARGQDVDDFLDEELASSEKRVHLERARAQTEYQQEVPEALRVHNDAVRDEVYAFLEKVAQGTVNDMDYEELAARFERADEDEVFQVIPIEAYSEDVHVREKLVRMVRRYVQDAWENMASLPMEERGPRFSEMGADLAEMRDMLETPLTEEQQEDDRPLDFREKLGYLWLRANEIASHYAAAAPRVAERGLANVGDAYKANVKKPVGGFLRQTVGWGIRGLTRAAANGMEAYGKWSDQRAAESSRRKILASFEKRNVEMEKQSVAEIKDAAVRRKNIEARRKLETFDKRRKVERERQSEQRQARLRQIAEVDRMLRDYSV